MIKCNLRKFSTMFFFMFSLFPFFAFAGPLALNQDAPAFLKILDYMLVFFSSSIQSQAIAFISWFISLMLGLQLILRGIAEILGVIANKTKTNVDNDTLIWVSKALTLCSKVIGWFGLGNGPKSIL